MLVAICMLCCVAAQGDVLFVRLRVCMVSFPMAVCPSVCLNAFLSICLAHVLVLLCLQIFVSVLLSSFPPVRLYTYAPVLVYV